MKEPNIIEKLETQPPTEIVEEVSALEKSPSNGMGRTILAFLLAILLLVVGVAGGCYLSSRLDKARVGEMVDETEAVVVEEDEVTWVDWEGEYLRAKLPEGWEIEELQTDVEHEYSGFGGIKIYNESNNSNRELLSVTPSFAHGYGGCACSEYYHFDDSGLYEKWWEEDEHIEMCGEDSVEVVEVTDYVESKFLVNSLRFTDEMVFADKDVENDVFDDGCVTFNFAMLKDSKGNVLRYSGGGMEDSEMYHTNVGEGYSYDNTEEILLLVQVLESIEIIPQDDEVVSGDGGKGDGVYEGWKVYESELYRFSFKYQSDITEHLRTLSTKYNDTYRLTWFIEDAEGKSFSEFVDYYQDAESLLKSEENKVIGNVVGVWMEYDGWVSQLAADYAHVEFLMEGIEGFYYRIRLYSESVEVEDDLRILFTQILESIELTSP